MPRLAVSIAFTLATFGMSFAQTGGGSDPLAITYAQQSIAALTGGAAISDVTLTANVTSSNNDSGTGTFSAKGINQSRTDLTFSSGLRSDVRSLTSSGLPSGAWQQNGGPVATYAQHNCWTDSAWFFPALSSLTQTTNPAYVFKYIGQEQNGGMAVQHIRVFQIVPKDTEGIFQRLSTMDFYLDVNTNLPDAIATNTHPDNNMGTDIALEVRFASYQTINGVMVPLHFQQIFNGDVVLDITVTNAVFNTGLPDSLFTLP